MIDSVSAYMRFPRERDFDFDSRQYFSCDLACIPSMPVEDLAILAPYPIDGSYHSDVASSSQYPAWISRLRPLHSSFVPSNCTDEEIISLCIPRHVHDMSDVQDYVSVLVSNIDDSARDALRQMSVQVDDAVASSANTPSTSNPDE